MNSGDRARILLVLAIVGVLVLLIMYGAPKPRVPSVSNRRPRLKPVTPLPINDEIADEIRSEVRAGFEPRERIIEIFREEKYRRGELNVGEITKAVDDEFAKLREEQKSWPAETDCDRLDKAFNELNSAGIIALQNAGFDQSDGYGDFRDAYNQSHDKSAVAGYCFYHGQDLERAQQGEGLLLAFGPVDAKNEPTLGPKIGQRIVKILEAHGFKTEWNGKFNSRIKITRFEWKKRIQ